MRNKQPWLIYIWFILVGLLLALTWKGPAQAAQEAIRVPKAIECWPRSVVLESLKTKYKELAYISGVDLTTGEPFTIYINFVAQTSSYVLFPQPGIACIIGGKSVTLAKSGGDL